jgi:hypothetical protein
MTGRPLTAGEVALARSIFGAAIDYAAPRIVPRKWAFFQPRDTVMAPLGNIHFHPLGTRYRDDFANGPLEDQGLLIHELVHVWQHQKGMFLPLQRHPFCRYGYQIAPGRPFERYGIEQQGEIVRHAFLLRHGVCPAGATAGFDYEALLPFR